MEFSLFNVIFSGSKRRYFTRFTESQLIIIVSSLTTVDAIKHVLGGVKSPICPNTVEAKRLWKLNLKEEQWKTLKELVDLLEPFLRFTEQMSYRSRSTISLLLPNIYQLQSKLGMRQTFTDSFLNFW